MKEIPINKRFALGWYNEGVTHLNIREYEEAMSFFQKALSIIPDHPDFLLGKGDVLFAIGKYEDSYHIFASVLEKEPENVRALLRTGTALLKLNRNAEAIALFERGIALNDYDGELWLGKGIAQFNLGLQEQAAGSLRKAGRYKPNQPAIWYYLSRIEPSDEGAVSYLLRGYRLDPTNLDILLDLIERLLKLHRNAEAVEFCKKAHTIDADNPRLRLLAHRCVREKKHDA
jgi:tetratricopeptide (TPR) repeat protein